MSPKTTSLQRKLILPIALVSLFIAIIVSSVLALQQRQQIMEAYALQLTQINLTMERQLLDIVDTVRRAVITIAQTPATDRLIRGISNDSADALGEMTPDQLRQRLQLLFIVITGLDPDIYEIRIAGAANNGRELVAVENRSGTIAVIPDAELESIGNREFFESTRNLSPGQLYHSPITLHRNNNTIEEPYIPTLRIATPLYTDDGEFFGIVVMNRNLESLFSTLTEGFKNQFTDPSINMYITNGNGDYLFHPDPAMNFGFELGLSSNRQNDFRNEIPVLSGYGSDGFLRDSSVFVDMQRADTSNGTVYTTTRDIYLDASNPTPHLSFLAEIPLSVIDQPIYSAMWRVSVVTFLSGFLIMIVLWRYLRQFLRPLMNVTNVAEEIADGEYQGQLPESRVTEIASLINSLNTLQGRVAAREKTLKSSENFANKVIDTASQGIAVVDQTGKILRANASMEEMFEFGNNELLNMRISRIFQKFDFESLQSAASGESLKGQTLRNLVGLKKNGGKLSVDLGISRISAESSSHILITVVDMTEYRALERQLIKSRDELELKVKKRTEKLQKSRDQANHLLKSKSEFLANMSHEIRTPMTAILGLLDVLRHTDLTVSQQKYVFQIHNSSKALLHIINDILDISKIEAGKVNIENLEFSVVEAVESAIDLFAPSADMKGISLHMKIDPTISRLVLGDRTRLTQVLNNLLGNAIKFTEKGEILLSVENQHGDADSITLRFSVADTGIGISAKALKRLFKPFEQADSATTRLFGGTGLGLAISHKLVELMGGKLNVDSRPGKGSTFYFELTFTPSDKAELKLAAQGKFAKHVLVVDDQPIICDIIGEMLKFWGCKVVAAFDGSQALKIVTEYASQQKYFDLLIVDWRMPEIDGYGLIKRIHGLYEQHQLQAIPPVLMITAAERSEYSQSEDYQEDINVIVKPVTVSKLLSSLSELDLVELVVEKKGDDERTMLDKRLRHILQSLPHPPRILLAEDNVTNQMVIREILTPYRLELVAVENGAEAVAQILKQRFDLVLMDLQMPIMDGFEATRRIRESLPIGSLPILALSAATFVDDFHKSDNAGMDEHLTKPIDVTAFLRALTKYLAPDPLPTPIAPLPADRLAPDRYAALLVQLQQDPDFDLAATLFSYAGKDAYFRITEAFVAEFGRMISDPVSLERLSLPEKLRFAHSLKGAARSIGAIALGELAAVVELELQADNTDNLPALVGALQSVLKKLG